MTRRRIIACLAGLFVIAIVAAAATWLYLPNVIIMRANEDYEAVKAERDPIYAGDIHFYRDGGSRHWTGLGYQVIHLHRIAPSDTEHPAGSRYEVGAELEFTWTGWFPFHRHLMQKRKESKIE